MIDDPLMLILLVHAGSTLAMCGLIWFVQIVHYPLMARVGCDGFVDYEREHMSRTTWVVAPLMLLEVASAALLVLMVAPEHQVLTIVNAIMLVLIWCSTGFLQVPAHRALSGGFEERAHRRLVATNWVRTVLWSARSVLACLLIVLY